LELILSLNWQNMSIRIHHQPRTQLGYIEAVPKLCWPLFSTCHNST